MIPFFSISASSFSISGITSGGGGGGLFKMTVATQAPRLIGLVLNGSEVIVKVAAEVITPPSRLEDNARFVNI